MGKSLLELKHDGHYGEGTPFDGRFTGRTYFDVGVGSYGRPKWWDGEKWIWWDSTDCDTWSDDWPDLQGNATEIEEWGNTGGEGAGDDDEQIMIGEIQSVGDVDWATWETSGPWDYRVILTSISGKSFRVTFLGIVPGVAVPYVFIGNTTSSITSEWTKGRTGVGMHVKVGPTTPGDDYGDFEVSIERKLHVWDAPWEGESITRLVGDPEGGVSTPELTWAPDETKWFVFHSGTPDFGDPYVFTSGLAAGGSEDQEIKIYDPVTNVEIVALTELSAGGEIGVTIWLNVYADSNKDIDIHFSLRDTGNGSTTPVHLAGIM